ncbi:hypothetical protein WJX77_005084 [Trebouxia sp. C0004]
MSRKTSEWKAFCCQGMQRHNALSVLESLPSKEQQLSSEQLLAEQLSQSHAAAAERNRLAARAQDRSAPGLIAAAFNDTAASNAAGTAAPAADTAVRAVVRAAPIPFESVPAAD